MFHDDYTLLVYFGSDFVSFLQVKRLSVCVCYLCYIFETENISPLYATTQSPPAATSAATICLYSSISANETLKPPHKTNTTLAGFLPSAHSGTSLWKTLGLYAGAIVAEHASSTRVLWSSAGRAQHTERTEEFPRRDVPAKLRAACIAISSGMHTLLTPPFLSNIFLTTAAEGEDAPRDVAFDGNDER